MFLRVPRVPTQREAPCSGRGARSEERRPCEAPASPSASGRPLPVESDRQRSPNGVSMPSETTGDAADGSAVGAGTSSVRRRSLFRDRIAQLAAVPVLSPSVPAANAQESSESSDLSRGSGSGSCSSAPSSKQAQMRKQALSRLRASIEALRPTAAKELDRRGARDKSIVLEALAPSLAHEGRRAPVRCAL